MEELEPAMDAMVLGEFEKAVELSREVASPGGYSVSLELQGLHELGRDSEALELVQSSLDLVKSSDTFAKVSISFCVHQGDYELAEEVFTSWLGQQDLSGRNSVSTATRDIIMVYLDKVVRCQHGPEGVKKFAEQRLDPELRDQLLSELIEEPREDPSPSHPEETDEQASRGALTNTRKTRIEQLRLTIWSRIQSLVKERGPTTVLFLAVTLVYLLRTRIFRRLARYLTRSVLDTLRMSLGLHRNFANT
ncbi:hypothetical protein NDN08_004965 [Rhodosorus marinus]|uniref:Uncharacterized protein n=1 Tax=Rhodosorus marinus TaxID=101924 RepID=A0AAV8UF50_9RHOD|nr:hypothetical protein NDN08_004965 [Rhodosorus marinus]